MQSQVTDLLEAMYVLQHHHADSICSNVSVEALAVLLYSVIYQHNVV
jgi:hypothetical protein